MMNEGPSRSGRRPGESGAREQILEAARVAFAERGFAGATMRGIAAAAGVDAALVSHYFGSKQGLFVEAVQLPVDGATLGARLRAAPAGRAAESALAVFLEVWEREPFRTVLLSLLRAAFEDEKAAGMLRHRLQTEFVGPAIASLGLDQAELRSALIASQMVGLATVRYILRFDPLASLPSEEVARLIAPTIQRYMSEPLEGSK